MQTVPYLATKCALNSYINESTDVQNARSALNLPMHIHIKYLVQYYAPFTLTTIYLLSGLCAFYVDDHLPNLNTRR